MRTSLTAAAFAALLAACSPPAQREAEGPRDSAPQVQACNDLAPMAGRLVRVEEQMAVASAASDLRGGAITPGVYDLTRAARIGEATGWQGERAVSLEVSEDVAGAVTFNWAGLQPNGDVDRWTASFNDAGAHPILSYTCGRMGEVAAEFTAQQDALTLRVPDGANGSLQLEFQRRS